MPKKETKVKFLWNAPTVWWMSKWHASSSFNLTLSTDPVARSIGIETLLRNVEAQAALSANPAHNAKHAKKQRPFWGTRITSHSGDTGNDRGTVVVPQSSEGSTVAKKVINEANEHGNIHPEPTSSWAFWRREASSFHPMTSARAGCVGQPCHDNLDANMVKTTLFSFRTNSKYLYHNYLESTELQQSTIDSTNSPICKCSIYIPRSTKSEKRNSSSVAAVFTKNSFQIWLRFLTFRRWWRRRQLRKGFLWPAETSDKWRAGKCYRNIDKRENPQTFNL